MDKKTYQQTRNVRAAVAYELSARTDAPKTVFAWIRAIDKMELGMRSSAWPPRVPIEYWNEYVANCEWDLEVWVADELIELLGYDNGYDFN